MTPFHATPDLAILSFNKIVKGPGTSFQSPALLSQKHVKDICHREH